MSDGWMRRWFFFPARRHEEEVALVPSSHRDQQPPASPKEDKVKDPEAVQLGRHCSDDDDRTEPAARRQQSSAAASLSSSRPAWWRVVPTRGVGLVIAGLVVLAVLVAATTTWWTHLDYASSSSFLLGGSNGGRPRSRHHARSPEANRVPISLTCGSGNGSSSCPQRRRLPAAAPSASSSQEQEHQEAPRCPEYFRYIHSDLDPWRSRGGITREAVESGRGRAAFRLVVVGGRAFVETYHRVFQTRDTFTQWGIAQLLARYPGRVPDLDLMFNCEDMPEVRAADYSDSSSQAPPPLFRYCKDDATLDIVFPDWSFWGWPEVNIRPWVPLLEEMANETRRLPWPDREPYAYWKGNPGVSPVRADLLRCNASADLSSSSSSSSSQQGKGKQPVKGKEWNARVFRQDWGAAIRGGFRDSNLAKQCAYRYKIFVQGRSWSVSQKYILACDSPVLLLATPYSDFFSRGLVAGRHYWPIDPARAMMCPAIKFAVDWGNAHPEQAQRMAHEGSAFAREDLSMDYVYDYMLHLLTQYAKLLRYKPTVPDKAVELCPETLACPARARERDFMMQSRERYVADYEPCSLPPPFTADELRDMARRDHQVRDKVHKMTVMAQNNR